MCFARINHFFLTLSADYVGKDGFGNTYYRKQTPAGERRRVIYAGLPEASKVPAPWYGWLHYTDDLPPEEATPKKRFWQKDHRPNLTGTSGAWRPAGHILGGGKRQASASDYHPWRPSSSKAPLS
ncbi:MAG: NADH-ubiquinone oxidoreductase subunit NDUFA12 family protein [Alphaproteobacteria bacterium]